MRTEDTPVNATVKGQRINVGKQRIEKVSPEAQALSSK